MEVICEFGIKLIHFYKQIETDGQILLQDTEDPSELNGLGFCLHHNGYQACKARQCLTRARAQRKGVSL